MTSRDLRRAPVGSRLMRWLLLAGVAWAMLGCRLATAQEDGFRVALELIVFLHLEPDASTEDLRVQAPALPPPEIHPAPVALPDSGTATPPAPAGVLALTRAQYALESIWSAMRRSAEYRPLAHFAWAMPADWNGEPVPLRLSALSATALPFSGLVSLQEDRFAHVTLDLRLADGPDTDQTLRLNERRRLLPGEIHYFDHPRFGAIVRLFRYRNRPQTED